MLANGLDLSHGHQLSTYTWPLFVAKPSWQHRDWVSKENIPGGPGRNCVSLYNNQDINPGCLNKWKQSEEKFILSYSWATFTGGLLVRMNQFSCVLTRIGMITKPSSYKEYPAPRCKYDPDSNGDPD
jgi:hypothetical protein